MYKLSKLSLSLAVICLISETTFAKTTVPKVSKVSAKNVEIETSPATLSGLGENLFLRLAKSLAAEALDEFKEAGRRSPKQASTINMTLPSLPSFITNGSIFNDTNPFAAIAAGIPITIAVSALPIKAAILTGIAAVKAAVFHVIISILWILFLVSGTAYFVCNLGIVTCSNTTLGGLGGSLGGDSGGGLGGIGSILSRAGSTNVGTTGFSGSNPRAVLAEQYDRHTRPVYQALDEGYKKYQ